MNVYTIVQATVNAVVHLLVQILVLLLQVGFKPRMPAISWAATLHTDSYGFVWKSKDTVVSCISEPLESCSQSLHDGCPSWSGSADVSRCDDLKATHDKYISSGQYYLFFQMHQNAMSKTRRSPKGCQGAILRLDYLGASVLGGPLAVVKPL